MGDRIKVKIISAETMTELQTKLQEWLIEMEKIETFYEPSFSLSGLSVLITWNAI